MDNISNEWLIFFQTVSNRIKYKTHDMETPGTLKYQEFLDFLLHHYPVQNYFVLREEIDKFKTILVDKKTGEWSIQTIAREEATFEELVKCNEIEVNEFIPGKLKIENFSKEQSKKRVGNLI